MYLLQNTVRSYIFIFSIKNLHLLLTVFNKYVDYYSH